MQTFAPFPLEETTRKLLCYETTDIFSKLVIAIESYNTQKVTDMRQLKLREDKKQKGNAWEAFCKAWLIANNKYKNVWLLQDLPEDIAKRLQLAKLDSGIDIIAEIVNVVPATTVPTIGVEKCGFSEMSSFVPIQCKYRKSYRALAWNMFDSFVGLCALTGPWQQGLIMTNAPSIGRRTIPVKNRFRSLCASTFKATKRPEWCLIAGLGAGEILAPHIEKKEQEQVRKVRKVKAPVLQPGTKPVETLDQVRAARLAALEKN